MSKQDDRKEQAERLLKAETKYSERIRRILIRLLRSLPDISDPMDIVRALRRLGNNPQFILECQRAARSMATQVRVAEFKTWRQAAAHSSKGREIFLALKKETAESTVIGQTIRDIVRKNAELIQTCPLEMSQQLTEMIRERQMSGLRPNTITKEVLEKAPHLTQVEAKRIARTETGKAATALREARAQKYGRPFYIWWTSSDQRVRDSHSLMHGVVCRWDDPPCPEALNGESRTYGSYHPRGIFNCRCDALSVISVDDISFPAKCHKNGAIHKVNNIKAFRKLYNLDDLSGGQGEG